MKQIRGYRIHIILLSILVFHFFSSTLNAQTEERTPADESRSVTTEQRAVLAEEISQLGILPQAQLRNSFGQVPRHRFISGPPQAMAYTNSPLPLGSGVLIPSPEEHAKMIAAAGDLTGATVLVAGPESGYLAALVSRIAARVVQIEFLPSRAAVFSSLFEELGYANIEVRSGAELIRQDTVDRYDAILVAYGTENIPLPLIARLNQAGTLTAVLSYQQGEQLLVEYRRIRNGASIRVVDRVFFPVE
jgi:protein-L-isoaspartate(D-aspartate) O-methyltransferase